MNLVATAGKTPAHMAVSPSDISAVYLLRHGLSMLDFIYDTEEIISGVGRLISLNATLAFEPAATKAYRVLEHMIVTLELAPGQPSHRRASLIDRPGLGPAHRCARRSRGSAWEGCSTCARAPASRIAPLHPGDWLRCHRRAARRSRCSPARPPAVVTREAADLFHDAALAMQKAVIVRHTCSAFIHADKALDEAFALAADNPFRCTSSAALQTHSRRFGSATKPSRACRIRPSIMSR